MSGQDIIAFSGVGKSFASKTGTMVATRDITVSVHEGEIISIVGPSGCGKTTMLNLVAGLMMPTQGTVSIAASASPRLTAAPAT